MRLVTRRRSIGARGRRRAGAAALLVAGAIVGLAAAGVPAGAHVGGSIAHLVGHLKATFFTKSQANARFVNAGEERVSMVLQNRPGALPVGATFRSKGGTLVVRASGSGFAAGAGRIGAYVSVDGVPRGSMLAYTNEGGSHKAFVPAEFVVTGLPRGSHTLAVLPMPGTVTDSNDFFTVSVREAPSTIALAPDATEPTNNTRAGNASLCTAALFGGVPHNFFTLTSRSDVDWLHLTCQIVSATTRLRLTGGPRMDVFEGNFGSGSPTPSASKVRFFEGPAGFYTVRIFGSKAAYTFTQQWILPAPRAVARRIDPDGRIVTRRGRPVGQGP